MKLNDRNGMLERIIENWLDKASEKSFQLPFCYILASEGHTILHLTRHALMEYGKDIVSIDPEGQICAFQLKGAPGGKIGFEKYRSEILAQLDTLTTVPFTHPSLQEKGKFHRSYFVTNGYLSEEVAVAIETTNRSNTDRGMPERVVHTITRGELLARAKKIKLEFLPADLKDFNLFLELYLEDGGGMIKKDKLARLLESLYSKEEVRLKDKKELIAGVAIIVALATSNHSNENNHLALVEAWTLFISYTYRFIELHELEEKYYKQELRIARETIINELEDLFQELTADPSELQATGPAENLLYNARMTWLSGFIAYLGIYYDKTGQYDKSKAVTAFLKPFEQVVDAYGEAAFAPLLAVYWQKRISDATQEPLVMLKMLFNTILEPVQVAHLSQDDFLPDVYQGIEDCLINRFSKERKIEGSKFDSYYAEPLLHLLVRENQKQFLKVQWAAYTRLLLKSFRFTRLADCYLWRCPTGDEVTRLPKWTQEWKNLQEEALPIDAANMPEQLRTNPLFLPLFLQVFPHRVSADLLKYFDVWVRDKGTKAEPAINKHPE